MWDMQNTVLKWKRIMLSAISGFRPGDPSITCNKMKLCAHLYTEYLNQFPDETEKDRSYQSGLQQSI